MKVDNKTVDTIAHLARLEFDDTTKAQMINDMNNMLAFVEKLNEIDTSEVQPLIYMSEELNVLREDIVNQNISQNEALKNSAKHDSDYFKVPKMIEK